MSAAPQRDLGSHGTVEGQEHVRSCILARPSRSGASPLARAVEASYAELSALADAASARVHADFA